MWQRAVALIVVLNFLLTACSSLQGVPLPGPDQPTATPAVKVGEIVEITTRAGETNIAIWVTVGVIVLGALIWGLSQLSPGIQE